MALIQYTLTVGKDGNYNVTSSIVEVDAGDRIQFRSNAPDTAIVYQQDPSFKESDAPTSNGEFFEIGRNQTKGPFTVTKTLTAANKVKFDCGQVRPPARDIDPKKLGTTKRKFVSWRVGQVTPDNKGH